jgi:hypothetical protein
LHRDDTGEGATPAAAIPLWCTIFSGCPRTVLNIVDDEPEMIRFLRAAVIASALALPIAARADTNTYAVPTVEQTLHGVITSINGMYGLTVRDDRAEADSVTLHHGTVINPTGLQLTPGMQVTITGHPDSSTFDVNEIDASPRYFEAQQRTRRAHASIEPWTPLFTPNGTFQTNGPTAEGGG